LTQTLTAKGLIALVNMSREGKHMTLKPFKQGVFSLRESKFLAAIGDGASFKEVQQRLGQSLAPMQAMIKNLERKEAIQVI